LLDIKIIDIFLYKLSQTKDGLTGKVKVGTLCGTEGVGCKYDIIIKLIIQMDEKSWEKSISLINIINH
jgi:hypothetical protein